MAANERAQYVVTVIRTSLLLCVSAWGREREEGGVGGEREEGVVCEEGGVE